MIYSKKILRYFNKKKYIGILDVHKKNIVMGSAGSAVRGDIIQLFLKITPTQKIAQAKFKVQGSVATIAAAAWLTEYIQGKSVMEIKKMDVQRVMVELGLLSLRQHCVLLAIKALENAILYPKRMGI